MGRLHLLLTAHAGGHRAPTIRSSTAAEPVLWYEGAVAAALWVDRLRAGAARAARDDVGDLERLDQRCWRSLTADGVFA